jgi:hypothetical protein
VADKLSSYNNALILLEERRLATLSEQREPKRVLDALWDNNVAYCLSQGLWRFAKRVAVIDASTAVVPAFGYLYGFKLPDDWVRTVVISTAPTLDPPLLQYNEETGYVYANASPLYVSYISNDVRYGLNIGAWPPTFTDYVEHRLAWRASGRLAGKDQLKADLERQQMKAKRNAKAIDAMNDPPGLPPLPFLVRARRGAFGRGGLGMGSAGEN